MFNEPRVVQVSSSAGGVRIDEPRKIHRVALAKHTSRSTSVYVTPALAAEGGGVAPSTIRLKVFVPSSAKVQPVILRIASEYILAGEADGG